MLSLTGLFAADSAAPPAPDAFKGVWKIDHSEAGSIYLIVWDEGRASYFFTANPRVEVFPGEWEISQNGLTITWEEGGYTQLFLRDDVMKAVFAASDPARVPAERTEYTAVSVPRGELGKWARPPDAPASRAAEGVAGFFGNWSSQRPDGSRFFIIVEEDRTAASSYRHQAGSEPIILRGSWRRIGSDLHMTWSDGSYAILRPRGRGHEVVWFEPGVALEGQDRTTYDSIRVQIGLPQDWLQAYRSTRFLSVNIAVHRQPRAIQSFFRGYWDVAIPHMDGDYVEIRRFGNARTNRFGGQRGKFRTQPDSVFITWGNGVREIIQVVGTSFVLTSYRPGQPLDGQPERVFPLLPREREKLDQYREGKTRLFQF